MTYDGKIVLGSRSPQRLHLLEQLVPRDRIVVLPPFDSNEDGFQNLHTRDAILERLTSIARIKCQKVLNQIGNSSFDGLVTADTTVIVGAEPTLLVLGKPDGLDWQASVREWFISFYSDSTHEVVTACCCLFSDGSRVEFSESTTVRFKTVDKTLLDWYISSAEPLGKAGGYGIQTAGSLFIDSIAGSLSNVIGLPLEKLWKVLHQHQIV